GRLGQQGIAALDRFQEQLVDLLQAVLHLSGEGRVDSRQSEKPARDSTAHRKAPPAERAHRPPRPTRDTACSAPDHASICHGLLPGILSQSRPPDRTPRLRQSPSPSRDASLTITVAGSAEGSDDGRRLSRTGPGNTPRTSVAATP